MEERKCPSCGADPGSGSFCQHCGNSLAEQAVPSDSTPQAPAPTPATPPQTPAPAPAPKRRGLRGCLIAGVVVLVLLVVGGFFVWRFVSNEILPGVQESVEQFTVLSDAPPGPCYDVEVEDGVLTDWTEVPCDGPHHAEVSFAAAFGAEGPYPGDDYMTDSAADTCRTAFENYVGVSPEQSAYDVDWLLPTEEMWANGVRNGICLVVAGDGSAITGTVKDSQQ